MGADVSVGVARAMHAVLEPMEGSIGETNAIRGSIALIGWSHALKELRRAPELIAAAAQEALPRERGAKIYYNRDEIGRRFQHRDHHHHYLRDAHLEDTNN